MPAFESDVTPPADLGYQTAVSGMIFGFRIDVFRDAISSPDENSPTMPPNVKDE